jgi:uncharacterized protein (DUF488 family)
MVEHALVWLLDGAVIYYRSSAGTGPHTTVYTVGHSNICVDRFVHLLRVPQIQLLVDVRSQPYSRYAPQFNRESLTRSLEQSGIVYLYLGGGLGGRPREARFYGPEGTLDVEQLAAAPFYREGLERLKQEAIGRRLAIMCSEADYRRCHRFTLIARSLVHEGVEVLHILHSGALVLTHAGEFAPKPRQLGLF